MWGHSEDPNCGASSSSTSTPVGDYEGRTKKMKRNDYEVFLSFRGKDTRKGFTDYLYTSLVDAGIHVFRDDNELCVGEEIGPELLCSITQSKISIPIISEDYASSKWCLRELALMLNCKRNKGQMVLPIFYKVEPWQVKHLTGRFGDAINTHKKNLEEKIVKEWEEALKEVTFLKGLESEKIDNGHEGTLVKTVVRKVTSKLKELFLLNVPKQLVGINDHVEHIMRFIDAKFSNTSIIGIYGMGGIGKTTLAKVLYNRLQSHYESHSFVADIREKFKLKGLECIQKQLIYDISGGLCDVSNVDHGISILKSRYTSKKVLILLDDVDDNTHLNALVEDGSWFKAGSMVIITTRDKSILDKARVRHMYQLNGLLSEQSLVLFSRHAFRTDSPPSDYGVISRDIVSTTGGLPLALEVIGSFLCGKTKDAWKATSKKLKKVPNKKVQEKLRISYDALDFEDQQIFLDIACFFIGSSKQNLTYMWEACGFFPGKGIEVLNLMSLIKISNDGKLLMHDQLRDLGREIIRQENLKKPQKRSRLWEYEDGIDALLSNKGTSKIEALRLDLDNGRESYTAETFKELTKLRLLQLEGVNLTGHFQNLFPQLRLLEWMDHQPDFELTNFHLKKLVVLDLSWSKTSENWGGWSRLKIATELKVLNLSNCALRTTPDLSAFKSLEILILEACEDLKEIHPSIEDIKTLVSLNVSCCWKLKELPLGVVLLKRPHTPAAKNSAMDYQTIDSEHVLKRSRPFGILDEVNNLPANVLPISYNCPSLGQSSYSSNDLPGNVVITLSQGSLVKSMDFHPVQQILLLVGTNMGNVMVWEVGSGARIALRKFKVWDLGTCSMALQASLANDYTASINRVMWSPDGILFGVAYSKHMVHIYSHHGGDDIRNHLELEAHVGSVNDLAFSYPNEQLCVVTCGEDRLIKVWDVVTGAKQQTFEGHEAPVYSICPHNRENIQFIFSAATDGKIKAWFYDNVGSRVEWDAPGHSFTKMACSADGIRLFSCGTNKEGESYLVEWNESEGAIKRTYHGLGKRSDGSMQFDTAKNRFLAAGDESMVKFWDMDNKNILTSIDADGGLPASPCIRFNKEGILLAVSTNDNSIKILANADGIRLLRTMDNWPFDASRITLGPVMKDGESMADVKPGIADESGDKSRIWRLTEIKEPLQCRSIRLPDDSMATRVSRLIYTNSGLAILALSSNAVHKLWKWGRSDRNLTGRATTSVVPQLWQPASGILMTNAESDTNPKDVVSCFALSKNDSYVISASGGKISLFNMMTFKMMTTFLSPPLRDNDGIVIEMDDSTIQICSGQVDEIQTKLKRRQRIIRGFAFSASLHVLMSSGADSQTMTTFTPSPPRATFLAFYPQDNNIIAIGMEDSSIHIYNVRVDEFKANLKGHQKRITGLAFSNVLNVLVSSGADSQLHVWSIDGWENQVSRFLEMPTRLGAASLADTRIQFNVDKIHLLVVHETQIATYEATKLKCLQKWVTREARGPITDATYSCNGQSIYVSFEDGSIGVFTASTLRLRCSINPTAYIPPNPSLRVYALVIAAHPSEPNQFALGLTDGSVYILEPLEHEGKWGTFPPVGCNQFRSTPKPPPITTFHFGNATVGTRPDDRGAPVAAMVGMNNESMEDAKPRITYESGNKSQIWKLKEINEPLLCRSIRLHDILTAKRVSRLIYTNSGLAILALSSNAVHQLWKWRKSDRNLTGTATTSVVPQLWHPPGGNLMTNDTSDTNPEDTVPCFALSKNDSYVISASGGKISLFNMITFKTMTTFMPPPPAATFLAFHPQDNNIIAIGMEDSSIQIYNVRVDEVKTILRGHQKRITGLAFSNELDVLVSSSTDSQLCVWSTDGWEKQVSRFLRMPTGQGATPPADTRVQFHVDQIHLLVVRETQIATYEAPNLECLQQVSREASGPITDATYSCDGQSVYVSSEDGSISVLTASTLRLRCRINPAAYIFPNPCLRVYPLVIAAHPFEPNQFALGLTDGGVHVLEPLECEGEWGASPPVEDCVGPSTTSGTTNSNQLPSPMANEG